MQRCLLFRALVFVVWFSGGLSVLVVGWQHGGMVGKGVRAGVGFAVAGVAGAAGTLVAGGAGWLVAVVTGAGGAIGGFVPGWVDALNDRARWREEFKGLSGPAPSGSLAGLLRPERGVVPFMGRDGELSGLLAWCGDESAGAVRLVVGAGGVGKSRLAGRLMERLAEAGWACSWVGEGLESEAWERAAQGAGRRVLLVLDYAETRPGLAGFLQSVAGGSGRVRVLLLARGVGEWWDRLGSRGEPVRDLVDRAGPVVLGADLGSGLAPGEVVAQAVPYFARVLGVAVPKVDEVAVPASAQGGEQVPVLVLHAAALVAVLNGVECEEGGGSGNSGVTVSGVLRALLGHEQHLWEGSCPASSAVAGAGGVRAAVAVACLVSPVDLEAAERVLGRVPEFAGVGVGVRRDAARWLRGLYPPVGERWWGSLAPDLVAEHHVCEVLGESGGLPGAYLGGLPAEEAEAALTVLARAAVHHAGAVGVLEQGLRADLGGLAVPAVRVAVRTGGVLGPVLARVFEQAELSWSDLVRVKEAIPYPTTALAVMDLTVTRRILAQLPSDAPQDERARWDTWIALALDQAGRPREALPPAQEAVEIRRRLAQDNPDRYLGDLAQSLNSLGVQFLEADSPREGLPLVQEAVEIRRRLAQDNPDRYLGDLAQSLHSLGFQFALLDSPREGLPLVQEAVEIRRRLAQDNPDRYLGDLAQSLHSLGVQFALLDSPREGLPPSQEAVEIRRRLAQDNPDHYLGDLAASLNNLGNRFSLLGRPREGLPPLQEAIGICRRLAQDNPDRYLGDLAAFLYNLGNRFLRLDRPSEAFPPLREAVEIRQRLAQVSPDRYLGDLATSLNTLGNRFLELGRPREGLPPLQEAVEIRRRLAQDDPDRYLGDLAQSLSEFSALLDALDRPEEAAHAREEATSLRLP